MAPSTPRPPSARWRGRARASASTTVKTVPGLRAGKKPTAEAVLGVTLLESPDGLGCRVNSLTRGGAAMMSGLQVGDIILAVNGEASSGEPDVLATALRRASGNVGLDVIRVYASMSV